MNRSELEKSGFNAWIPLLGADSSKALPRLPGVYAVSYDSGRPKAWPNESCGGWHKKRNPAVDIKRLDREWLMELTLSTSAGPIGPLRSV